MIRSKSNPRGPLEPDVPEPIEALPDAEAGLPPPDLGRLRELLQGPFSVRSLSLPGLFLLGSFYTLYLARAFFMPLVLALLFSLLLTPVVRFLKRWHLPEPAGAALVLLMLLGTVGVGIYELSGPAYSWIASAPQSLRTVEAKLRTLKKPVQTLGKATEQMARIAEVSSSGQQPAAVAVEAPSLGARLFNQAADLATSSFVLVMMLYFLLASGDLFLRKLIKVLPRLEDKRRAAEIARQVETDVSRYLGSVTMLNLGLGIAVWISMALIGLPNPLLWGAMVTVTNFVPYLGAALCYIVLGVLGFLTFKSLGHCLLPPAIFLGLNTLEALFVTPTVLGRRLTLNPVLLFLSLTFWGFLWGVPGAILAVPIMVVFKILCDHIEPLAPIGEFLGR
jgi:predicted PurR-regulated permease PerM